MKYTFFAKIAIFLFTVVKTHSESACQERYVAASLYGELGNQMAMITTALVLAWDTGAVPVFPDLNLKGANIPINYKEIFFRLNSNSPNNVKWDGISLSYEYTPIISTQNTYLFPWGFDLRYWDRYRNALIEVFQPRQDQIDAILTKYPELADDHIETVGVHVRLDLTNTIPFCGFEYFREAVSFFSQEALLIVGSNRIEWVKKNEQKLFGERKNIIFLEENCHTMDFNVLRMCKHNIICASTFSFWAAYLNTFEFKKVIAPSRWYNYGKYANMGWPGQCKGYLYPDDWIVLDVPVMRWTPSDVQEYTSTSINS